jgi:hypothetical protein
MLKYLKKIGHHRTVESQKGCINKKCLGKERVRRKKFR